VFADEELRDRPYAGGSALRGETYSFQVAYWSDRLLAAVRVKILSDPDVLVSTRSVGLVPSELPCYHNHDERILRSTPGLYPDPLFPLEDGGVLKIPPKQWRALWITVEVGEDAAPGPHAIEVVFETETGEQLGAERFELDVIPVMLPKQELVHTEWFHTDCLATYYNVDVFSEEHWKLIDQYVQTAARHGINMILTPLFTPPLDTAVGGERPTVQLVDVEKDGDVYRFGFERLDRWIDLCTARGIEYFEFSHLFTQWGAKHAPKIVARENGELRKIFGWETDAHGPEYRHFLSQFLPRLVSYIRGRGLEKRSYFHISDEPKIAHLEQYESASRTVREYLDEFPIIDALSDYAFYEKGLVKNPIPANNHIDPFIEHNVRPLWTYYCCSQFRDVSNRFFNFPSARNRILGMQLYKFDVAGFLHWGYNFWNTQYSKKAIDPYRVTDAGCAFPSGDAFLVYPGEQGQPVESIRMEVFFEALQDLRALKLLEQHIGRDAVVGMLEEGLDKPLSFREYPIEAEWLLAKREQINRRIRECAAAGR
jgi:hypothetical protein